MTIQQLTAQIISKRSFLCIGLDTDKAKLPEHLLKEEDPVFEFNKSIIKATHHLAVAFKLNTAFYEAYGVKGWNSLQKTIHYLNKNHPEIFTIADAKRGDIGNTAAMYAKAFFETLQFDSVTIAPYMGKDSVAPFLTYKNKYGILLALTSNEGSGDFQFRETAETALYKYVLEIAKDWEGAKNLMYVVGATKASYLTAIRRIVPDSFLLVPGVGAQGGNLQEVCKYGMNEHIGLLINASRSIIYASNKEDFVQVAVQKAMELQQQMKTILNS
ncbi:MAG: orotidine-5'-phosphate decarboxylase [Bacteroidota bacterium]